MLSNIHALLTFHPPNNITRKHLHFTDEETQAWKGEVTSQGHIPSHALLQGSLGNETLNHSSFTITDVKQIKISYDWSVTG